MLREDGRSDRELDRRSRREAGLRVPRRAGSSGEALDVVAGRPRVAANQRGELALESAIPAARDDARTRAGREAEDVVHMRGRSLPVASDRGDANGDVAARKRHPEGEAAAVEFSGREAFPVRVDEHPYRSARGTPRHEPVRHLPRGWLLDRRRRKRWHRDHEGTIEPSGPCPFDGRYTWPKRTVRVRSGVRPRP